MTADSDPDVAEPLDRLAQALSRAAETIVRHESADRERLVGQVRDAVAALHRAAAVLSARAAETPPDRDVLGAWLHELRAPITVITGWALMLGPERDAATHIRAADAIERNAKLLMDLLAREVGH